MLKLKKRIQSSVYEALRDAFPLEPSDIEIIETPCHKFGDLALPFPFQLARKERTAPRAVAEKAAPLLAGLPGVREVSVAGGGYINLFLDRQAFMRQALDELKDQPVFPEEDKVIIEHTNINPNKAAHIGHLRNACLGDTLARCLRFKGEKVEVQNYIDDTGVQVVDVVFGLMELERKTVEDLERIAERFDYYCWDLYTRTSAFLAAHPEAQARKAEILKKVEHGQGEEYVLARYLSRRILRAHLATMKRLGVSYDVLPCESTILQLKFWEQAFEQLKQRRAIHMAQSGPNAGCWVIDLEGEAEREKVIVRSDGTVTYVGKDIAYQLWKFGLLGRDFHYEPFCEEDGRITWITSARPARSACRFGGASKVFNVIDTRQSYLQKVVVQGLRALGHTAQAEKSVHFSYEMVALSPKSLKELDYTPGAEEAERSFLEVSGRKGLGVKADDLLDRLEEKALAEVEKRNPELGAGEKAGIAKAIAAGALRYFMLKFARNTLIVFDFDEALNFEGETGPYLMYTAVRLASILRKLQEREKIGEQDVLARADEIIGLTSGLPRQEADDFWDLMFTAARLDDEVLHSTASLELAHLAKFSFELCQKANTYYHRYQILSEADAGLKAARLLAVCYVKDRLGRALELMGIPLPGRM
jgi:arginyl-tRNA synthetase